MASKIHDEKQLLYTPTHSKEICNGMKSVDDNNSENASMVDDPKNQSNGSEKDLCAIETITDSPDGISIISKCTSTSDGDDNTSKRDLIDNLQKNVCCVVNELSSSEAYRMMLRISIASCCSLNEKREFKTFSVDAMRKPGLPVYLNTYSMEMNYSPRYFPDGDIKNNYSVVWNVIRNQDESFNVVNYITPYAHLQISGWKVYFTDTDERTALHSDHLKKLRSLYVKEPSGGKLYIIPMSAVKNKRKGMKQNIVAVTLENIISKNPHLWDIQEVEPDKIAYRGKPFK